MIKEMEELLKGKINETFFYWMEALFGYDSNGVLVETGFPKTLIYQFDYKTREIQRSGDCSYHFEDIKSWKLMKDDEGCYFLELMDQDGCLWWRFRIQWLSDVPPVPGFMESMADSIKSFTEILERNKKKDDGDRTEIDFWRALGMAQETSQEEMEIVCTWRNIGILE